MTKSLPFRYYTYSLVPWNLTAGSPANGAKVVGTWQSTVYNGFHAATASTTAVYAAYSGGGYTRFGPPTSAAVVVKVELATGVVKELPMSGFKGRLNDLVYVENGP